MKRKASSSQGRYVKRRKGNRKPRGLPKVQVSAMKRVAKAVLKDQTELKHFKYENTQTDVNSFGGHTSYNLFFHGVTRGTGDNQFLGDKLRWKGIAIKYQFRNGYFDTNWVYSPQPVVLDFYIVRIPHLYTTIGNVPLNTLYNTTTINTNMMFLQEEVKVLKKKTVTITPNSVSGQVVNRIGKIWLRRDQMITYDDFDNGWGLKNGLNYYMIVINRTPAGSSKITLSFAWQNYFVDS